MLVAGAERVRHQYGPQQKQQKWPPPAPTETAEAVDERIAAITGLKIGRAENLASAGWFLS